MSSRPATRRRAKPRERIPKVGFVSLGCPKALVDSERILTTLRAEGYEVAPTYEQADLVVVNTCGFIDAAIDESLQTIGEALERNGKVIVTGCLGARPRAHPRAPSARAQGHGAADLRRGDVGRSRASAAAARSVSRPRAAAGRAADAASLRVSQDLRGLQQQMQLLHHPGAARQTGEPPHRRRAARSGAAGRGGCPGATGHLPGHQRLRSGHPLCARSLARQGIPDAIHRPGARPRNARHLGPAALRLSVSARRRGHSADGGAARAAVPRHPVPARQPVGAEAHAAARACREYAAAHRGLAAAVP